MSQDRGLGRLMRSEAIAAPRAVSAASPARLPGAPSHGEPRPTIQLRASFGRWIASMVPPESGRWPRPMALWAASMTTRGVSGSHP